MAKWEVASERITGADARSLVEDGEVALLFIKAQAYPQEEFDAVVIHIIELLNEEEA